MTSAWATFLVTRNAKSLVSSPLMALKRLHNKIALVTGGSSGIGLATAKLFIQEGAFVYITGRRQDELDKAEAEIAFPSSLKAIRSDNASLRDLDSLFALIRSEKGRLDVFFANAGVAELLPLGKITEEHFDRVVSVNLKGTVFAIQKALPLMPSGASIVINGSTATVKGDAGFAVYSATKAALRSFARTTAHYLQGKNIRINVLSPGIVITPAFSYQLAMSKEVIEHLKKEGAKRSPLGRTGEPEEIAKVALFLASDDSSYITGTELFADGGLAQI